MSQEIGSINNIGGENVRYTIKAALNDNSDQEKPKLTIELKDLRDVATRFISSLRRRLIYVSLVMAARPYECSFKLRANDDAI